MWVLYLAIAAGLIVAVYILWQLHVVERRENNQARQRVEARTGSKANNCEVCTRTPASIQWIPYAWCGTKVRKYAVADHFRLCKSCGDVAWRNGAEWIAEAQLARKDGPSPQTGPTEYRAYLQSPEWQAKRKDALARAGHRCQISAAHHGPFDVHHNSYDRLGAEEPEDLVVLCRECHKLFHGK
jgi:5-methylcytosine-specific restriction endonuclease McrA